MKGTEFPLKSERRNSAHSLPVIQYSVQNISRSNNMKEINREDTNGKGGSKLPLFSEGGHERFLQDL